MSDTSSVSTPQNFCASQFILTVGPREIGLILGQTRHSILGESRTSPILDWHASYSMSATTAKQMHGALTRCLELYEEQFGPIPRDPNSKIESKDAVVV